MNKAQLNQKVADSKKETLYIVLGLPVAFIGLLSIIAIMVLGQ